MASLSSWPIDQLANEGSNLTEASNLSEASKDSQTSNLSEGSNLTEASEVSKASNLTEAFQSQFTPSIGTLFFLEPDHSRRASEVRLF